MKIASTGASWGVLGRLGLIHLKLEAWMGPGLNCYVLLLFRAMDTRLQIVLASPCLLKSFC